MLIAVQDAEDLDVRRLDAVVDGLRKATQQGATNLRINKWITLTVTFNAIHTEKKLINEFAPQRLAPILVPRCRSLKVLPRTRTQEHIEGQRLRRIASATSRTRSPLTESPR